MLALWRVFFFFKFRGKELYENIERELLFYYVSMGIPDALYR